MTAPALATNPEQQRLTDIQAKPIKFPRGDATIEFKFDPDKHTETIEFKNGKGQVLSYKIDDADKDPVAGEKSRSLHIQEVYREMSRRASEGSLITLLSLLQGEDKWRVAFELVKNLGGTLTGSNLKITEPTARHGAIQALTALKTGDPRLFGFDAAQDVKTAAPTGPADKQAAFIDDIRAGKERIRIATPAGGAVIDLALGLKSELTVTFPATEPAKSSKIAVRLDPSLGAERIVEKVQEIQRALAAIGPSRPEGLNEGITSDSMSRVALSVLSAGNLVNLENVELDGANWPRIRAANGCSLKNVNIKNSKVFIEGSFTAENLHVDSASKLRLNSPKSIFINCAFDQGSILSGDISDSVFVGKKGVDRTDANPVGTRLCCNAFDCKMRGLRFWDALDPSTERNVTWKEVRGIVFRASYVEETSMLYRISSELNNEQFGKELKKMDAHLPPDKFCPIIRALRPDIVAHYDKKANTLPATGDLHTITLNDHTGKKSLIIEFNEDQKIHAETPMARIRAKMVTHGDGSEVPIIQDAFIAPDLHTAMTLALSKVGRAPRVRSAVGEMRHVDPNGAPAEFEIDNDELTDAMSGLNNTINASGLSNGARRLVARYIDAEIDMPILRQLADKETVEPQNQEVKGAEEAIKYLTDHLQVKNTFDTWLTGEAISEKRRQNEAIAAADRRRNAGGQRQQA